MELENDRVEPELKLQHADAGALRCHEVSELVYEDEYADYESERDNGQHGQPRARFVEFFERFRCIQRERKT